MNKKEVNTYGEAADFVTRCDEDDIPIYTESLSRTHRLPVDNYLLFRDFTSHKPEEYFPLCFWDDEDGGFMIN
jgi:hypothetical protein